MSIPRKILIQAGHYNISNNCILSYRSMTGAPKEYQRNYDIAIKLIDLLNKNGFEAHFTDANVNCDPNIGKSDWDLFLSLHCDANYAGDEGGGFVDYPAEYNPDGTIQDFANAESRRIKEAIEAEYFQNTGIRNVPARFNPNTKYYYCWEYLSPKTPCVIMEMGESIDPHDNVILSDVNMVANAILKGIVKAFGAQTPTPPATDYKKLFEDTLAEYKRYKDDVKKQAEEAQKLLGVEREEWRQEVAKARAAGKKEMKDLVISYLQKHDTHTKGSL